MGNDVLYKTMYNTWLSSRLQNQPHSLARLIFLCLVLSFLGTMHSVFVGWASHRLELEPPQNKLICFSYAV